MQVIKDLSLSAKARPYHEIDQFVLFVFFLCAACSALKISLHASEHQGVTEGGVC